MDSTFLMFAVVMLVIFIGGIIVYKKSYSSLFHLLYLVSRLGRW